MIPFWGENIAKYHFSAEYQQPLLLAENFLLSSFLIIPLVLYLSLSIKSKC